MHTFETLLAKTAQALDEHRIPYMVIGGQAVLLYGEPRLTKDIDITLGVDVTAIDRLKGIVEKLRLRLIHQDGDQFIHQTSVLPVVDVESGIRIDFIFSFTPYERQAIERARRVEIGGTPVQIAALEDTIIHKIFAGRPRDLDDIKGMLNKRISMDRPYLESWLREFSGIAGRDLVKEFQELEEVVKR